MLIKKIILKVRSAIRSVRILLKIKQKLYFDQFFIFLPSDHKLPIYMLAHPKYDRFLPHLVKYIDGNKTVIDVGANCADTLASLVDKNQSLLFFCIEPDPYFYDFMINNINLMKIKYPKINVLTVKSLVGKNLSNEIQSL
jgi:hypothetical protein